LKIPKRVNAALDWMGHNVRRVAAVGAAVIISIAIWSWVPALSALVLGVAIGGTIVHQRMASRQAALRSDIDDLLRQNGALRREKLTLASGVLAKQTQLTAKLPVIPDDSPAGGDTGDQPAGPAARTDPTAHAAPDSAADPARVAEPTARVDPKSPDSEAPLNPATRTQPDTDAHSAAKAESPAKRPAKKTTRLPAIPDDPDV
jgi:cytochrome c556